MKAAAAIALALIAGCKRGGPGLDRERAAALFTRVTIETRGEHGLSGLAADERGALWTVAERGASVWRIELDGASARAERFAVEGVPAGDDLESIAVAPGGRLWVGTEGKRPGEARVYLLAPAAGGYRVERTETVRDAEVGVAIGGNHGVEGACAIGDAAVVALESVGTDARGRWAPVVTFEGGARRVQRLRLTSDRGKIAGLDCWADGDRRRALAIERHFAVTRVLAFELGGASDELVPAVVLDLAPVLRGALNLEGIARLPDGRVVAVVDNQYRTITGPDEVLVFRAPMDQSAGDDPE